MEILFENTYLCDERIAKEYMKHSIKRSPRLYIIVIMFVIITGMLSLIKRFDYAAVFGAFFFGWILLTLNSYRQGGQAPHKEIHGAHGRRTAGRAVGFRRLRVHNQYAHLRRDAHTVQGRQEYQRRQGDHHDHGARRRQIRRAEGLLHQGRRGKLPAVHKGRGKKSQGN